MGTIYKDVEGTLSRPTKSKELLIRRLGSVAWGLKLFKGFRALGF